MTSGKTDVALVGRESVLHKLKSERDGRRGVLIVGPAGSGKTALAEALAESASGFYVLKLHGTQVSRKTPYGAMARWLSQLPDAGQLRPVQVLQEVQRFLQLQAGKAPLLVVVDDADQLDAPSALVLSQLVRGGNATVIATARDVLHAEPEILELWSHGYLQRTDLEPLPPSGVRALMQHVLGRPVSEPAGTAMWIQTRGNPHHTILMTKDQVKAKRLVLSDGVWVMARSYVHTGSIAELFSAEVARLLPEQRRAVEILAFTRSLPVPLMLELSAPETLDSLQESGVVELTTGRTPMMRLNDPLLATVVSENVPLGRSHQLWQQVTPHIQREVELDPATVTAYVSWSLACEGRPHPDLVLRAAKLANGMGRPSAALLYAESVAGDGPHQDLLIEEVRALNALGENQRALSILRQSEGGFRATRWERWTELMLLKAVLLRSLPKEGNAQEVLDGLRPPPGTGYPAEREAALTLVQAEVWMAGGDYHAAVEPLLGIRDRRDTPERFRALSTAMAAESLAVTGRAKEAVELIEQSWELLQAPMEAADQSTLVTRVFYAFYAAGELDRASGFVQALSDGIHESYRGTAGELAKGFIHAAAGENDAALDVLVPGLCQLRFRDPADLLPLAAALVSYVYAQRGDAVQAAAYLDLAPRFRHKPSWHVEKISEYFRTIAQESGEAPQRLTQMAEEANQRGNTSFALACLEAAVSQGDQRAAAELAGVAAAASGRWAEALKAYGQGVADGDPRLLLEAAQGAAALGNHRLAYLAAQLVRKQGGATPAPSVLRSAAGVENNAYRKLRREHSLERMLEGLSDFEARLVHLARGFQTRTEIAGELNLSARTVDWHLGKLFEKLRVSGRSELREILG